MNKTHELLARFVPVFNDHQAIEGDHDLTLTIEGARKSRFFLAWCKTWGDDERGQLAQLLEEARG